MDLNFIKELTKKAETKVVLLLVDGIGGLPKTAGGKTELETAKTPNLDKLAAEGICGLHVPVGAGVTPGSGPAHLGVFGYDACKYFVGRGVLAALGIGFDLHEGDVAARGNFCTVDDAGVITDRRAGRIATEKNQALCAELSKITLSGAEVFVETVKEHRFLLVLRGKGLSGEVSETDPNKEGNPPREPVGETPDAEKTAALVKEFAEKAKTVLADHHPANMVLLRGFSQKPDWPTFGEVFGVRAAGIASYPMYRGLGKLIGMDVLETGTTLEDEFATLAERWDDFDFFYVHVKPTDSAGEDGDFDRKVAKIEAVDALVPRLMKLAPDVLVVTGDHSTPAVLKSHSWHPVPTLIWSAYCRCDGVTSFGEKACITGGLGPRIPAVELMPIAMANALRLDKYGA